jgi:predicted RNA methylase
LPKDFIFRDFDTYPSFLPLKVVTRAGTAEGRDVVSWFIERTNTWERFHMENMVNNLKRIRISHEFSEPVFIDIGANLGTYSLTAAAFGYKVYAFEPMSQNIFAIRYAMCQQPDIGKNIVLFEYALGEVVHDCQLVAHKGNT